MKEAVSESSKRGREAARKNAAYYTAKYSRALQLRAEGMPVTLIESIIKGDPAVNEYLMERDCAKAEYRAADKAIDVYRDDLRYIYDQIKREQSGDAY